MRIRTKHYYNGCLGEHPDIGLRLTETDKHGAYTYCYCAMCTALRIKN